ncbi:CidA/LrgA family protein [Desulfitobacterium sp. Sab5]|uniref:CidA/LrgA family protein n=1 Tax=Desulfitobacterium nosdiversum TaxID=3375356 RepID=UPI003CFB5F13
MKVIFPETIIDKIRKIEIGIIQIAILYVFSVAGNYLAKVLHLSFPGSLIGMGLLFLLLRLRIFRYRWVVIGGNWLLTELLLFFIPTVVAVIQYEDLIHKAGLEFLFIILIGSIIVMISSGLTAELIMQHKQGRGKII